MNLPVRDVLAQRLEAPSGRRRIGGLIASVGVHVLLVLVFVVVPMLSAGEEEFPDYVAVQIIPAQMLGSSTPTPPAPRPEPVQEAPPEPEPEPEPAPPVEEEPVEEAPPPPRPVVPDPEVKRPVAPAPAPKKVTAREPSAPGALSQREGSATGSQLGTSNFGAKVGFDNPDFTYDYYVDRMLARIREYWVRPSVGGSVEAMIRFRILKDGKVVDVGIQTSSGNSTFDMAAMRAVQSASPLPPLPQTFKHDSLGVNLVVR